MEEALKAYAVAADYGVADVTTAATYHIAALYQDFGKALMTSQRPKKLSKVELEQYNVMLEEQAFPFEEKATELHEVNAQPRGRRHLRQVGQEQLRRRCASCGRCATARPNAARESSMRFADSPTACRRARRAGRRSRAPACAGCSTASTRSAADAPAHGEPPTPANASRRRHAARDAGVAQPPPRRPRPRRRGAGRGRALRSSPRSQRAFDDARAALRAGRIDEAERGFRALAQAEPRARRPARQPRRDLPPGRQAARGGGGARDARSSQPAPAVYLNQLGITYRQQGQFAKARDAYEKAIALDPRLRGRP